MKIDLETLKSLLFDVLVNGSDASNESLNKRRDKIDSITYGDTEEWVVFDGEEYCLVEE